MNILIDGQTLERPEINRGIGIYFKNVINNMIKQDFINKWFITISDLRTLRHLESWVVEKINIIQDQSFSPKNFDQKGYLANEGYTNTLNKSIEENSIDIYWNPNPLMVNVLFPTDKPPCEIFATIYDLIPLIFNDKYIENWDKEVKDEYMRRLEYLNQEYSNLMFISKATANDFERFIGNNYSRKKITFLGADSNLFYRPYEYVKSIDNYEIIYVGGFDFRKNLFKTIEAFSKAKKIYNRTVMDKTKFSIICSYSEHEKHKVQKFIKSFGMTDHIELKGYVSDLELSKLYRECNLFFFPSIYEGFGLPVLEALLAGAYILTGNNSSLPEVAGEYAMYCESNNVDDMTEKIFLALNNSINEGIEKKKERKKYALQFSWGKTAAETLNFLSKEQKKERIDKQYSLAVVTPWLPQKTGIAEYVYKLIPSLSEYFNIDIFVDDSNTKGLKYKEYNYGDIYSISKFKEMHKGYDKILYQLGNNSEYHTMIYELAIEIPGIVEIHDYNINPFMYHSFFMKNKKKMYENSLLYYGEEGEEHYNEIEQGKSHPDGNKFPMVEYVASRSKGVIVHSRWVLDQLKNIDNVNVIPLSVFDNDSDEQEFNVDNFRNKYQLNKHDYVIGCLGFVNRNKRPEKIMEAVRLLKEKGYPINLIFFGSAGEEKNRLTNYAQSIDIDKNVKITGFLNEKDFFEGIYFSDIIINLRYPSMGESSATLCQAMRYSKPTIISNINQYKEFPDEVCWKVDVSDVEVDQLGLYIETLLKNNDIREALGYNVSSYASKVFNKDTIAQEYWNVLNKTL